MDVQPRGRCVTESLRLREGNADRRLRAIAYDDTLPDDGRIVSETVGALQRGRASRTLLCCSRDITTLENSAVIGFIQFPEALSQLSTQRVRFEAPTPVPAAAPGQVTA